MRKVVWLILASALLANVSGCTGKSADQPAGQKAGQKATPAEAASNKDLALKFLLGVQNGDKTQMYRATNLTPELANDSRDKLIYIKQNKLTDKQRQECEHALKISGDIDFFMAKLRKILPKTASLKISDSVAKESTADFKRFAHTVTVTYGDKAEALRDKTGKPVKELTLRLQQIDYLLDARQIHEFSFNTQDFEKMAVRDFEVVSYF